MASESDRSLVSHNTSNGVSWTLPSAVYHFEEKLNDLEKYIEKFTDLQEKAAVDHVSAIKELIQQGQASASSAVSIANDTLTARLASVNEFRAQLGDQVKTFATKSETDSRLADIVSRIDRLEAVINKSAGRSEGVNYVVAMMIALVTLVLGVVGSYALFRPTTSPEIVYVPAAAQPASAGGATTTTTTAIPKAGP